MSVSRGLGVAAGVADVGAAGVPTRSGLAVKLSPVGVNGTTLKSEEPAGSSGVIGEGLDWDAAALGAGETPG